MTRLPTMVPVLAADIRLCSTVSSLLPLTVAKSSSVGRDNEGASLGATATKRANN